MLKLQYYTHPPEGMIETCLFVYYEFNKPLEKYSFILETLKKKIIQYHLSPYVSTFSTLISCVTDSVRVNNIHF